MTSNLEQLYKQAVDHRNTHDCSAYPYEDYQKLFDITAKYQPKKILEVGTGIGFTAAVMALASPEAYIETIEKDQAHSKDAEKFIHEQNLSDRIIVRNEIAELSLPELGPGYDLIFFDGYQIHYEFLPHYERLLKSGGILVLGNNHLTSKTSDKFFEELKHSGKWNILEKFADTTIAIRK